MSQRTNFSASAVRTQDNIAHIDINLTTAIVDQVLTIPGDFVYVDQASTGAVSITPNGLTGGAGTPVLLAAGGSIECNFANLKISATAQLNKTVRLVICNGARIKGGGTVNAASSSVTMVDGNKLRTQSGSAFMTYLPCSAVAAQYSHVQLFNPVANTKNAFVNKITCYSTTTTAMSVGYYNTALATYLGLPPSKFIGAPSGTMQVRKENNAGGLITEYFAQFSQLANVSQVLDFTEPVLIAPGKGLVLLANTVNVNFYAAVEYFEE